MGLEAGNNRVLKRINKRETIGEVERSIKLAVDLDYEVV